MTVDAFVTEAHYAEHLQPILDALPEDRRGTMHAPRQLAAKITADTGQVCVSGTPPPSPDPLLVGGYQDLRYEHRPKVLVQHGAGQTYRGVESASFAGGPGHEAADLFLCPNEQTAALERDRYRKPAVAVGCPKLDAWARIPRPRNEHAVVAVTFHWDQHPTTYDGRPLPEAGTCWAAWRDAVVDLAKTVRVIGHAHPRVARELGPWWNTVGIEYVPRAVDLLHRADVLVLDNSSLGFEWAALDRPTVWLRGPDWTEIEHGLRFGPQLPGPELGGWALRSGNDLVVELRSAIQTSLERFVLARMEVRDRVYAIRPGAGSSQAAADAVVRLADGTLTG